MIKVHNLNTTFIIILFVYFYCINLSLSFNDHEIPQYKGKLLSNCEGENNIKDYFFVVTLNGKITIIDAIWGKIKWSKHIQNDPLISSTIGNVMKIHNGELIQVLPSLDGNLYVYHGDTIKKTRFSAEKLLKNSFKFSENVLLVGGQESKIIGLNLNNGDLIYDCGLSGCSNDNDSIAEDVVLLLTKSQSVRAINILTGQEEWHFVVHDPQLIKIANQECYSNNSTSPYTINFKVTLPNGHIQSLVHYSNDSLKSEIFNSWSLRLDSPIVSMWHLQNDHLIKINLFDANINNFNSFISKNQPKQPYFYLGSFNNHFYIQASSELYNENELISYNDDMEQKQVFIPVEISSQYSKQREEKNTQLMINRFPFLRFENQNATGYFVLQYNADEKDQCSSIEDSSDDEIIITEIVYTSLSYYWKEILFLCTLFSVAINTLWCLIKEFLDDPAKSPHNENNEISEDVKKEIPCQYNPVINAPNDSTGIHYNSRYLEDFEQLNLLGKGGFGMVFEAKHKIDESHYAVKRITIPAIEEKRHKFMREIRALSKLDHVHIVRYYNAWVEEPPIGWQEQQDQSQNYDLTPTTFEDTSTYIPYKNTSNNTKKSIAVKGNLENTQCSQDSLEIIFEETAPTGIKQLNKADDEIVILNSKKRIKSKDSRRPKNNNNNIIKVVPKAYIYIQMQLCKKETLKDWLFQNKKRDQNEIIGFFVQLLKAVNYVHANNLIHRDLKPSNILFSMDGLIKIGDFGLATKIIDYEHNGQQKNTLRKHQTHTNRVGTQLYMSPEQIKNQPYDHKVDIYSMGMIFYELMVPFNTESERIQQLQKARNKVFPDIFLEKYSNEKKIIEKLMAELPVDRPESAEILSYDVFCAI